MPRKKVTVIERKLKREKATGLAFFDDNRIEIEPRQKAKEWLYTLVHEGVHLSFPDASEADVIRAERIIGDALWSAGIRRVHLK